MKYVKYTYVDAVTKVPVTIAPQTNGPVPPVGVIHVFTLESQFPTLTPIMYGTTEGNAVQPGILEVLDFDTFTSTYNKELTDRNSKGFIPPSLLRQRAQKIGIWDDLAAYLVQYPALLLMVLTLEAGIDPKYPDLITGFNSLNVPQSVQDYLLADPSLGV